MHERILVVDDDQAMCELIAEDMSRRGFEVRWHTSAAAALANLKTESFAAVLTDLRMPVMDGLGLCDSVKTEWPDLPVIILTAFGNLQAAVGAIRAGAYDFVTKPVKMDLLAIALQRAVDYHALRATVRKLDEIVQVLQHFGNLIGNSAPMRELYERMRKVADSDSSALITGESGSGKELVARALHANSRRAAGPFVAVNCAGLPAPLLESELFGHARGAFTDAKEERKGLILQANGGTLLLDEIAEFPLPLQPKILRVLEERTVRPIGSDREVPFDVRVIALTNRDLESAVEEGLFREDLYYRINVINIAVPPLRARQTDILLLAQSFVDHFRQISGKPVMGVSTPAAERMMIYNWPGNVRELRNAVEQAVALSPYEKIAVEDLPERIRTYRPSRIVLEGSNPDELVPMEEVERRYILHVLKALGGNRTQAAHVLGINRRTLHRKLQSYRFSVIRGEEE
ncbi:MAG: sigma-54-dependent Fis family transcriptional regulator [Candidatus Hydrogenedentes bacterium]|nr:sigma-54-dependent Fis family transcriptional regulator [Candidatus Hydrogenedentota bacterium]